MLTFSRRAAILLAAVALPLGSATAQTDWPTQPVKIVAANTAGTAVDVLTRILAHGLSEELGQQFVVENRPGGGGTIGADAVARSPADGYTFLVISPPLQVITPNLRKNLPYDPFKSFTPVSLFATTDNFLIANPKVPNTVKEIIAYGKANPGKLKMANGGTGFQSHLANLTFANEAGIEVLHVAYKGAGFVQGVAAGEADLGMGPLPAVISAVRAGAVNAVGVASLSRSKQLPDVPTIDEAGLKGFESGGWTGITAPAGVPKEIVEKLSAAIKKVVSSPKTGEQLAKAGGMPWGTTPAESASTIQKEFERFGQIIRDNNVTVN